jgi:hypothetical protein
MLSLGSSCKEKIKEYKWLIALLAAYFGILLYCSPLDITQLNAGDKCFTLLYSATSGERLYGPLYTLIGWLATRLPINDGMSLSILMSILPAVGSVACVYFAIKKQTNAYGAPFFGALCLASSWVFISQALKVEIYVFAAFFLILGYTLAVYKKGALAAIAFGLALTSHWVTTVPAVFAMLLYNRDFRRKSYLTIVTYAVIYGIWRALPIYDSALVDDSILYSLLLFSLGWGSGSISDLFSNLSRIPIAVFAIGFGWISVLLYFIKDFKKAIPIIFIISIPLLYLIVTLADSGYMQMSVIIPFLAVAAGLGFGYIQNFNFKKVVVYGAFLTFLAIPIFWNIDTNPTTARDMINQLNNIPDKSIVVCYRQYDGNTDTCGNSVSWMVDYYNRENDKDIFPLLVGFLWDQQNPDRRQEIYDRGVIIPNTDDMYGDTLAKQCKNTMDALVEYNPSIDFYYYEITDLRSLTCELRKWQ